MAGEFDDIRVRLEVIAEELADLALVRLRESIDAGGTELPVGPEGGREAGRAAARRRAELSIDERRLTRARRAVGKAISVLREADDAV